MYVFVVAVSKLSVFPDRSKTLLKVEPTGVYCVRKSSPTKICLTFYYV